MEKNEQMVRLNSRVRKDQKNAVRKIAKAMSVTEGEVVRQSVDVFIKKMTKRSQ